VFSSSDLLVKLASIEVIEQFGNSEHGCRFLLQSPVLSQARAEFSSAETDPYTINKLIVLFAQLFRFDPVILDGRYW
jgi:hypothetical protein